MFTARYLILLETIVNGNIALNSFSVCSLLVYRKATEFCMLTLYSATLTKIFIRSKSYWWSLGSFKCRFISLQIGIIWLLPFLFVFILFHSLALLLWLRIQTLLSNNNGERGHPCFILDFRRNDLCFPHLVWCWL
jgi:hypothetical protein